MKRYEFFCSYDGGEPADEQETSDGEWVRFSEAEAAVKQARIDALDLAMEMCRNMVAPNLASNTAPYSAYEAACIDCESAIESLKGTP